jgi:hypothetical protein
MPVWFTWRRSRERGQRGRLNQLEDGALERRGGIVRVGQIGLTVSAWLYAACIAVQVFLAGLSTGLLGGEPDRWTDHISFGQMIGTLPILLVIFALVGRLPVLTIVLSVAIFFLYGLQYPFANTDTSNVAALHAVNALVMFWLTTLIAQQAQRMAFQRSRA